MATASPTMTLQSGSPQSAALNGAYAPLVVLVSDGIGRPLPGAAVTFVAPVTGASGAFVGGAATVQVTTNAYGLATAPAFTANGVSGSFSVLASVGTGASVAFSLTNAGGAAQSISFGTLPGKIYGDPPFGVSATASSGLVVSFVSLTNATCTVNGTTVSLVAAGTCTIRASQSGNAAYAAAPNVDQSFGVIGGNQTIVFAALGNRAVDGGVFIVNATASSGLPVSFSSLTPTICAVSVDTVALISAGTCAIRAAQSGDTSYSAAPNIDRSFSVTPASQAIAFNALTDRPITSDPMLLHATASSGLPVSFASRTPAICAVIADLASMVGVGTCTIRASQAGNANYLAAPSVDRSFAVARAAQVVSIINPGAHAVSATPFALSASSSSGSPIVFATLSAANCVVTANMATVIAAGTCTIRASQAGDANYAAAHADQTFPVVSGLLSAQPPSPTGPFVAYATYLGGYGADKTFDVVVGPDGAAYVGGSVASSNFPGLSSSAFTNAGLDLLFVARVDPDAGRMTFSTVTGGRAADITGTGLWSYVGGRQSDPGRFLGGGQVEAMASDSMGNVYVASYANSVDYPVRGGTYVRGGAKYIFRIGPTGAVQVASNAIDPAVMTIRALAVDASGAIYLTGASGPGLATTTGAWLATMPTPTGTFVTASAPYLIKLAPGGVATAFATYLSAAGRRAGTFDLYDQSPVDSATTAYALAVDASGNSYVAGQATPDEFPVTTGSPDTSDWQHRDAFVAKVNPTGTALLFVARLGGADADRATGIAVSPDGTVVIGGKTATQPFLGTSNSFQPVVVFRAGTPYIERETGFVAKLAADGSKWLFIATLGTDGGNLVNGAVDTVDIAPVKVAVDANGAIYAAGTTSPYRDPVLINGSVVPNGPGGVDTAGAFVVKISPDGSRLLQLAALGGLGVATGLAVDAFGNTYVSGYGSFMTTVNASLAAPMYESDFTSGFVAKLNDHDAPLTLSTDRNPASAGQTLTFTATIADPRNSASVEFDDGTQILGTVPASGGRATLPVSLPVGIHRIHATLRGGGAFDGYSAQEVVQAIDQAAGP